MDISSLCQRDIVSVGANASIREAAEAMRRHHVGALVVTDPEVPGRAIGVVTDRNLVVDLLAQGLPVEGQAIGTLCSTNLIGVPSTATLPEAVQEMRRAGVRRLLVVRPGGSLAGLVSADDLFGAIAGELEDLADALRSGIAQESLRTTPDTPRFDIPRNIYLPGHEP
ncbi:MAG: CBS domain-containing protein [Ramlibacter sp.]|nr:CBS domain-containing protein [Ramlibacter sp.]